MFANRKLGPFGTWRLKLGRFRKLGEGQLRALQHTPPQKQSASTMRRTTCALTCISMQKGHRLPHTGLPQGDRHCTAMRLGRFGFLWRKTLQIGHMFYYLCLCRTIPALTISTKSIVCPSPASVTTIRSTCRGASVTTKRSTSRVYRRELPLHCTMMKSLDGPRQTSDSPPRQSSTKLTATQKPVLKPIPNPNLNVYPQNLNVNPSASLCFGR